jgi:hypothetical protein
LGQRAGVDGDLVGRLREVGADGGIQSVDCTGPRIFSLFFDDKTHTLAPEFEYQGVGCLDPPPVGGCFVSRETGLRCLQTVSHVGIAVFGSISTFVPHAHMLTMGRASSDPVSSR